MSHRNETFLRNLYAHGPFQGHALVCSPKMVAIPEHPDYDYTLLEKPVANWVPWVVENYRRQVALPAAVGDDAVPFAWLQTGTHLYAAAFGCAVHRFPDLGAPLAARDDSATPSPLPLSVRRKWAALIKRVYEVDPLICPHCKATMRIVSFVEDEDVIYRILKHLDLLGKDPPVGEVRVRGAPALPAQSA